MMQLDVQLRLLDKLSRPAADAEKRLASIGAHAERLTNRFNHFTGAVRGLAGAVRGLAAADAALGASTASAGRLRGTMAGINPAASKAATGLNRFTRSADSLANAASKATGAVDQLHTAMGRTAPAAGFITAANTQLRDLIALQRQATAGMGRLNAAGGGRGGRRGMGGHGGGALPGLMAGLQPHGGEALHGVYEQATSLQDAIVRMHLNGLSDSQIAAVRAKADEVARTNKSTNVLSNLNAIMEARLALGGDLDEALATAGEMAKLRTIAGFSLGKDRAKGAEEGVYDMLRTGEIRGLIADPARRGDLFKGMTAALIASNGRITPAMWHKTALYGRSSTQGLSDQFENYRLPFLMQELQGGGKGGPAGVALQALFRAIPLATQKLSNIGEWRRLGFIDESKVEKDDKGHDKVVHPGAITLGKLAISDPDQAVYKLMDAMNAHGITDRGAMIQEFAQLIGTGTGQTAVDILGLQRDRMDNFERTLRQVEDSDTLFAQINETASQSVTNLTAQMDALKGNIGSAVIPAFTSLTEWATRFVGIADRATGMLGRNGSDPVKGTGGLDATQLGLLGGAGVYGAGWLAARFPWLARMGAGAAGAAATGNPFGALLGPTLMAGANRFLGMLPGAVRTGLTAGLRGGLIAGLAYEGGKALIRGALSFIPKPTLAPDAQKRLDADRQEWDGASIFSKPGLIWKDITGGRAGDYLPGGRLAGARAAGGPVSRGLSYLVGERGPEIFTPGTSGGVSTNRALGLMLSAQGGEHVGAGDERTAREVRYLSFALCSAVDNVSRSLDRLGMRYAPLGIDGEGGSGIMGGAIGGRRGFMSHFSGGGAGGLFGGSGSASKGALAKNADAIMGGLQKQLLAEGVDKDHVKAAAAALMGNVVQESGGDPTKVHDNGTGYGLYGARLERRDAMFSWLAKNGYGKDSAEGQARYMAHEAMSAKYGAVAEALKQANQGNLGAVTDVVAKKFEKPAERWANYAGRRNNAARAFGGDIGGGGSGGGDGPGMGSGSKPVELAHSMLGAGSGEAARALGHEMHTRQWCADFVNAALARTGGKGTGNALARSFLRWGQHVDNSAIKAGDVLVNGGHVGFARGPAAMHNGQMMIPMIAGNHGNRVGESWEPIGKYEARRGEQPAIPPALAEHVRERGRRDRDRDAQAAAAGQRQQVAHGPITINVHSQPHHDPKHIARAVHEQFNDAIRAQSHDGAYA